ncbi:TonB-dependent heme/hemoglobin receptor family protein [Primorskyibacter flagellatus]|uniref:TonB-dependent heme/hemoglobin receptor family protein n=1 Tax=Primorskyibacter flagellatus TaxID=1387277 RepID=A0A916ZVW5_9RHOB|nr:TonB-dependent receptor [Primorskyibacter flagellatus]GGE16401.1 TonB-dependent heme/hemoglobin receptor family protein [Primorskyibacter flagellatus]
MTRSQLLAGTSLLVPLALPLPALAQETVLDTIRVQSMRGVSTNTATAETTLDQEELDQRQASTLAELMGTVPGVTLSNAATPQGSSINIRGLGADAGVYGSNTKVNVVIDGVAKGQEEIYRQGSLLTFEPDLFKQVKVIRGPSEGFRFSSGAIGGTVEAVTKDAADFLQGDDTFAFRQRLAYESNGTGLLSSSIIAWRPDERLDVLAFYGRRESEDYKDGNGVVQADTGFELPAYLVKVKYHATPDLSFSASYSRNSIALRDVSYDFIGSAFAARVDADITDETAYLAVEYNPPNPLINLTAKLVYTDELIENVSSTTSSTIYNADNRTEKLAFVLENKAEFMTGAANHSLLTGIEVGKRERSSISHTGGSADGTPGGTDEYVAVYVTDEIDIGALTITPQLRWEKQKITSIGNANPLSPRYVPVADGQSWSDADGAAAVSARYAFTPQFAAFGTLAYNTSMPLIDDIPTAAPGTSTEIVTTEKAITYELGLSYDAASVFAAEDRLAMKLTGFKTEVWNNTTYTNYNSAAEDRVDLQGVELELSYAHPAVYVDLNASRMRAKWGDGSWFNNAPADSVQLTVGKRFMDDQLDLSVEMRHDWATNRNVQFGGTVNSSPAFTTWALSAAYKPNSGPLDGVEFRGGVENLFDTRYTPYLSSRPAPGRTFKFSVVKVF